ncbi:MAG: hypothetical protein M4579_002482 [Chaenotheca gracillima]|nr:MAG: hypothetical protein M4579_002482 [Chaenotheca gracillima]
MVLCYVTYVLSDTFDCASAWWKLLLKITLVTGQVMGESSQDAVSSAPAGNARGGNGTTQAKSQSAAKKKHHCRYFGSATGCRAGDQCRFIHDPNRLAEKKIKHENAKAKSHAQGRPSKKEDPPKAGEAVRGNDELEASRLPDRPSRAGTVDPSKVVQRPIPQSQKLNPREYQIQQVRRRYSPTESSDVNGTSLSFLLVPTDPDFPFEIDALKFTLNVPSRYPTEGIATVKVTNEEIPRGHRINVEEGFNALRDKMPHATLLTLINGLDKNLESFLAEEKRPTIKLVPNVVRSENVDRSPTRPTPPPVVSAPVKSEPRPRPPTFTQERREQARLRREAETRQLEARLGRQPRFAKSADGIVYTVPLEPRRREDLPVPLQSLTTVKLFVPLAYDLDPCRIEFQGVSPAAAQTTEKNFARRVAEQPSVSLMGYINYLSTNMHVMATEEPPAQKPLETPDISDLQLDQQEAEPAHSDKQQQQPRPVSEDKSHIKVIPRPPEWTFGGSGSEDDSGDYTYDSGDEFEDTKEGEVEDPSTAVVGSTSTRVERGTALSFPFIELHGIELLELVSISITIKCERCKQTMDIANLRHNIKGDESGMKTESCSKCATPLTIGKLLLTTSTDLL